MSNPLTMATLTTTYNRVVREWLSEPMPRVGFAPCLHIGPLSLVKKVVERGGKLYAQALSANDLPRETVVMEIEATAEQTK